MHSCGCRAIESNADNQQESRPVNCQKGLRKMCGVREMMVSACEEFRNAKIEYRAKNKNKTLTIAEGSTGE